jgi:hypothetical protein
VSNSIGASSCAHTKSGADLAILSAARARIRLMLRVSFRGLRFRLAAARAPRKIAVRTAAATGSPIRSGSPWRGAGAPGVVGVGLADGGAFLVGRRRAGRALVPDRWLGALGRSGHRVSV